MPSDALRGLRACGADMEVYTGEIKNLHQPLSQAFGLMNDIYKTSKGDPLLTLGWKRICKT